MKLNANSTEARIGDFAVVLTTGSGRINWFIRTAILKLTKSKYDHAFTYVGLVNGVESILEATPRKGFKMSPLSNYNGCEQLWSTGCFELTGEELIGGREEWLSLQGNKYNFLDIVVLGLSLSTHIPTYKWIQRRLSNPKHLICSQAVDLITQAQGLHLFEGVYPGQVTPGMLATWIETHQPA